MSEQNSYPLKYRKPLLEYIEFWEKLSRRSVPFYERLVESHLPYSDPIQGLSTAGEIMDMLEERCDTLDGIKYSMQDYAWGNKGLEPTAYLSWQVETRKGKRRETMDGITVISFSSAGKVASHREFWTGEGGAMLRNQTLLERGLRALKLI